MPQMDEHDNKTGSQKQGGWTPGPFLIASRKRTLRSHRYITFWRPERMGYAWPLPWAGRYDKAEARLIQDDPAALYADEHSYAVPISAIEPLFVRPRAGDIDGDNGPVLRNTAANWAIITACASLLSRANPSTDQGEG